MRQFNTRTMAVYRMGPTAKGVQVKAATADSPSEIMIYDAIGADPWSGGGVSASDVVTALAKAGDAPVKVRINSPGGDVFDGMAIYNALRQHAPGVDVVVDGIAASAASFIAMAGKTLSMPESSMLMIHNASTITWGQASDHIAAAGVLAKIDGQIADIYQAKSGNPAADMMAAETWLTAAEAKDAGLCDTVIPTPKADAKPKNESPSTDPQRLKNILTLSLADS